MFETRVSLELVMLASVPKTDEAVEAAATRKKSIKGIVSGISNVFRHHI